MDPIARWHEYMRTDDPALLDALLADDVMFQSPAVHTPQVGKAVAFKYLRAAAQVLGEGGFRYLDEWRAEQSAVLEFECVVDGLQVNGVDIVHWNERGLITRFKVMIRPMKALHAVVPRMSAALGMTPAPAQPS
ncbi:MAG: hypothetical protein AVDCRST_MAG39-1680 [uncultured Sphingomonadaceae bacterium]|uniref:SnoaL-like domain-containing protein n=1 Tax=uncultured Sphingomonadaceae bacterium TaxID=169976 RepID=A0A6J4SV29_9SPHN|nr:MAG: hypothetical protein AVDCRST_MAG39-1680 [uncultured Sphingomonadaceae bacterium]